MAAILAAVNAYIEQEASQAQAPRQSRWSSSGRLAAATQHLAWLRRPRR